MCTLTKVDQVGVRELRVDLAAAVRRAGNGERILVTINGQPVAQLGPVETLGPEPTLVDLAARGLVQLPIRADRPPSSRRIPLWAGVRLDRIMSDLRGR